MHLLQGIVSKIIQIFWRYQDKPNFVRYQQNDLKNPKKYFIIVHHATQNQPENKPKHDKTNKMACAPIEDSDQVWSEPSLSARWVAEDPRNLHADSEDSDQTDLSLCWTHRSFCWFCHAAAKIKPLSLVLTCIFTRAAPWWIRIAVKTQHTRFTLWNLI